MSGLSEKLRKAQEDLQKSKSVQRHEEAKTASLSKTRLADQWRTFFTLYSHQTAFLESVASKSNITQMLQEVRGDIKGTLLKGFFFEQKPKDMAGLKGDFFFNSSSPYLAGSDEDLDNYLRHRATGQSLAHEFPPDASMQTRVYRLYWNENIEYYNGSGMRTPKLLGGKKTLNWYDYFDLLIAMDATITITARQTVSIQRTVWEHSPDTLEDALVQATIHPAHWSTQTSTPSQRT